MSPRTVAAVIVCALAAAPPVSAAAPTSNAAADPLTEAKAAHAEGQALFDTADYAGAVSAWTRAYAALPAKEPKSATYRPLILYNIAAAREKLFELSGDVTELRQAKILLERFDASIDELYGADPATAESERSRVREKIAALQARIAAAQTGPEPTPDTTPPPRVEPERDDDGGSTRGRGLVIGGAVVTGLGLAAVGGLVAAAVISKRANDIDGLDPNDAEGRADQFAQGDRANAAAIAMAVVAPVLVAGGVTMLALGLKRRSSSRVSAAPSIGRHGVAWVVGGRF